MFTHSKLYLSLGFFFYTSKMMTCRYSFIDYISLKPYSMSSLCFDMFVELRIHMRSVDNIFILFAPTHSVSDIVYWMDDSCYSLLAIVDCLKLWRCDMFSNVEQKWANMNYKWNDDEGDRKQYTLRIWLPSWYYFHLYYKK